ncbi:hypothetical protein LM599_06605 [Candidatus Acetothermia bacterium]|jgi:hypothetical protein|nr:hypothetical protein [Candidatus Acetothermia bacterium]
MKHYIECDAPKNIRCLWVSAKLGNYPTRLVEHDRKSYGSFLKSSPPGSRIAGESVGN